MRGSSRNTGKTGLGALLESLIGKIPGLGIEVEVIDPAEIFGKEAKTKVDEVALFKVKNPEQDDLEITVTLSANGKTFEARRIGTVVRHIDFRDLPTEVANLLSKRQMFNNNVVALNEKAATIPREIAEGREQAEGYEQAAQRLIRNFIVGKVPSGLNGEFSVEHNKNGHYTVLCNGLPTHCEVSEEQANQIAWLTAPAEELRIRIETLEETLEAYRVDAEENGKTGHKVFGLAASHLEAYLEKLGNNVISTTACSNKDNEMMGVFVVMFKIDEVLGTYPATHLPEEMRHKIAKSAVDLPHRKSEIPIGTFKSDIDTPVVTTSASPKAKTNGHQEPTTETPKHHPSEELVGSSAHD